MTTRIIVKRTVDDMEKALNALLKGKEPDDIIKWDVQFFEQFIAAMVVLK